MKKTSKQIICALAAALLLAPALNAQHRNEDRYGTLLGVFVGETIIESIKNLFKDKQIVYTLDNKESVTDFIASNTTLFAEAALWEEGVIPAKEESAQIVVMKTVEREKNFQGKNRKKGIHGNTHIFYDVTYYEISVYSAESELLGKTLRLNDRQSAVVAYEEAETPAFPEEELKERENILNAYLRG